MGAERQASTKSVLAGSAVGAAGRTAAPRVRVVARPAWADRFRTPTPQQLVAGMPTATRGLVVTARESLRAHPQASEALAWLGTWQWTFHFRTPTSNGVSWAYLIVNPGCPQLCIPVHEATLGRLAGNCITNPIRDRLLRAPMVDGVRWATWQLQSKTQVNALLNFAAACDKAALPH